MNRKELPIPPHFNSDKVGEVWRTPYQERAAQAERWAKQNNIKPAASDRLPDLFTTGRRTKHILCPRI